VVVGASLGFITSMMLSAVQAAGDLLDLFGGLSLAFAFDPFSNNQSSVFGRFYQLLTMTLLFATDGYQLIVRGFLQSFHTLPLNAAISVPSVARMVTDGLPAMFLAALQIAGPLIAVLFCADVALGLLNRVAPALNAFSLGFPAKILLVVVLAGFAITLLPQTVHALVEQAVRAVLTVARR
jgi:flagellar biosynthetic protein FliR